MEICHFDIAFKHLAELTTISLHTHPIRVNNDADSQQPERFENLIVLTYGNSSRRCAFNMGTLEGILSFGVKQLGSKRTPGFG